MSNRREFLKDVAGATAGLAFLGCGFAEAALGPAQAGGARKRREVMVGGRRVRTIDVHSHCYSPEVWELVKHHEKSNPLADAGETSRLLNLQNLQGRLAQMDERGIDMAALSVNPPNWYFADRDLARQVVQVQNEKLAEVCASHPDRFVGLAATALQHPDLAAQQLEEAVKKLNMRGTLIGGSVNGEELSDPKFHPFWAKAEELGALVFIHPQSFKEGRSRFQGNGWLENIIGNPLESTTALLHLIFEGTLDKFPGAKICIAHAGGFLPSYVGRSDRCGKGLASPERCHPVKKLPSEYIKQIYYDTLIFTNEGLRHLIAEVGIGQIVLGTDAPGGWDPEAVDFILGASTLSDADRRAIFSGNLEKLLRIKT
jgi:aminocarboxymuconate-semialdehyde decarboxylase